MSNLYKADPRWYWHDRPMFNDAARKIEKRLNRRFRARVREQQKRAAKYG